MSFRIGCAIWAYKGWLGDFFPAGTSPTQFLKLYSRKFTTVEVNATFYSVPSMSTLQRWRQETPNDFHFCPKLPRSITHDGLLVPKLELARSFMSLMEQLNTAQTDGKSRLGPVFIQLPPSYSPQFFPDLAEFLGELKKASNVPLSVEVRHPQWFTPSHTQRLNALLTELSIGRVLLDTRPIYEAPDDPQLHSERKKPRLPLQPVITAPFSLIRYISHPDRDFNKPFMQTWVPYLREWLQQGHPIYLFVHCPVEEHSPRNAAFFHQLLSDEGLPIPPLDWHNNIDAPQQLNLFS